MRGLQRQNATQKMIEEMSKQSEYVDKNCWDAFVGCMCVHGGGFFYIGEYFLGIITFIVGYAMMLYGVWLLVASALSYFWQFERCWGVAFIWIGISAVYDVILGIWAARMTRTVRERAKFVIDLIREKCAECHDKV